LLILSGNIETTHQKMRRVQQHPAHFPQKQTSSLAEVHPIDHHGTKQ